MIPPWSATQAGPTAVVAAALRYPIGVSARWLALILLLTAAAPTRSSAQATPRVAAQSDAQRVAIARALFDEGLRYVDDESWSLAADRFARVLALRYSAVAAHNLALSRARLGRSVQACEDLRELLKQPALEPTVRDAAATLLHEQEASVAWLTVRLTGSCGGCTVQLDQRPWPSVALGVPAPVDPGRHVLSLVQEGRTTASTQLEVARGQRLEIALEPEAEGRAVGPIAPQPSAVASPPAPAEARSRPAPAASLAQSPGSATNDWRRDEGSSLFANPWFWGASGAVVVGAIVLGVALGAADAQPSEPVPGDFNPAVLAGEVKR